MQDGNGQHKKYVINGNALREYYQKQYTDIRGGEYKCILPPSTDVYFPPLLILNIENLDWEPIKLPQTAPTIRADAPDALHQHWSNVNPIPQDSPVSVEPEDYLYPDYKYASNIENVTILSKKPFPKNISKIISEHFETSKNACLEYNKNQINIISAALDVLGEPMDSFELDDNIPDQHRCCYCTEKCQRNFNAGNRIITYVAAIDKYILNIYNGNNKNSLSNSFLRAILQALIPTHSSIVATLILRRIIGLCKVRENILKE